MSCKNRDLLWVNTKVELRWCRNGEKLDLELEESCIIQTAMKCFDQIAPKSFKLADDLINSRAELFSIFALEV